MISDADGETKLIALQRSEMKGGVRGILAPKAVVLIRELLNFLWQARVQLPENAGLLWISRRWRPVAESAGGGLGFGFLKEEIQFAGERVMVHLLIPASFFASAKPFDELLVVGGGKTGDGGGDFLDSTHHCILASRARDHGSKCAVLV